MEQKLTHFDEQGQAVMVDVTGKAETNRVAIAKGRIRMSADTLRVIREGTAAKGDALGAARIAGIMAAKAVFLSMSLRKDEPYAGQLRAQH